MNARGAPTRRFKLFFAAARNARRGTESISRLPESIRSALRQSELRAKSAGHIFPWRDRSDSRTAGFDPQACRFFLPTLPQVPAANRAQVTECHRSNAKFFLRA